MKQTKRVISQNDLGEKRKSYMISISSELVKKYVYMAEGLGYGGAYTTLMEDVVLKGLPKLVAMKKKPAFKKAEDRVSQPTKFFPHTVKMVKTEYLRLDFRYQSDVWEYLLLEGAKSYVN